MLAVRLAAGDRFAHALFVVDVTAVLPLDLVPIEDLDAARSYLEELGAAPVLERLDTARVPG